MKRIYWIIGLFWIGFTAIVYAQSDKQPVSELLHKTIEKKGVALIIYRLNADTYLESMNVWHISLNMTPPRAPIPHYSWSPSI